MAVDLLQRIGLNKYEAEAYLALLADGPLTGYELGKRSSVPLSKSYEVLERLTRRGLALVQPGDPPRYLAERPERVLARTRAEQEAVLGELAEQLASIQQPDPADGFWVLRGRHNVLTRAGAAIDEAHAEVVIGRPGSGSAPDVEIDAALERARTRGCRVVEHRLSPPDGQSAPVIVLVDGRESLAGTLAPADHCQAVVSANPALALAIRGACAGQPSPAVRLTQPAAAVGDNGGWLDWEARKHQQLRRTGGGGRVA
ncbi:MAG: TrmB family transcriptional regulator [Chloroflexi bacterium]|nr:TrmB family transcriptional regulator [Chloroflexota bacterium]